MQILAPVLAAEGGFNPLAFDPSAFFLTLTLFVALVGLLTKFAWNPILNALDAREKRIEDAVGGAESAKAEAEALLAEHRQKLADAERDIAARIEEGRAAADRQADEILQKARADADAQRERAVRDIEQQKQQALNDIRDESVRLSKAIAEQVLARELNDADHERMANEVLSTLR